MKPTQQINLGLSEDLAQRLSALEAGHEPEDVQWLGLDDDAAWGEFDEQRFLKELRKPEDKSP
jgi:hypothetical protein